MVNVVIRTGVVFHVNTETQTALEIFYRNIRSVSTKRTELFDNVCYVEFQTICLNETCLNDICFYHKLFPVSFTTVRSDTVSSTKSRAAVLTAVSSAVGTYKHRCDLQVYDKRSGSKLAPKLPAVYLLVITAPSTIPNRTLFLCIFVYSRRTLIPKITLFFDWGFLCSQLSLAEWFALSNSFLFKIKNCTSYLAPLVLLRTYRLTAVFTQFQ